MVLTENKNDSKEEENLQVPAVSDDIAIDIKNLTMEFNISKEKIDTVKEYVIRTIKRNKAEKEKIRVLEDISFTVYKGDRVGILGFNGAGKSTLLKIISGIYEPTEGEVKINGKIAPLLELGAGFDSNYSGKNNIYLNAAFLSIDKKLIDERYDEIVEFSELGEFINYPVKNYSSGMRAKLGFSIATMINPDILIIDEILSVGDIKFRDKSSAKLRSLMSEGVTVLLVSHAIGQIREICNKCIWIENGHIVMYGESDKVCDAYEENAYSSDDKENPWIELPEKETYNLGEYVVITFKKEENGEPLANQRITFYVDDERTERITNEKGKAGVLSTEPGEHRYKISFHGTTQFNPKTVTFTKKILDPFEKLGLPEINIEEHKTDPWIHVNDQHITKGDYIIIELKEEDENGIPIAHEEIDIYIDDDKTTKTTDENGKCCIKTTELGIINIMVDYPGNENVNPQRAKFTKKVIEKEIFAYDGTDMDEDKNNVEIYVEGGKTIKLGDRIYLNFIEKETGKRIEFGEVTTYINNAKHNRVTSENGRLSIIARKLGPTHIKINYHGNEKINPKTILFTKQVVEK